MLNLSATLFAPFSKCLESVLPLKCQKAMVKKDPTYRYLLNFYVTATQVPEEQLTKKIKDTRDLAEILLNSKNTSGHLSPTLKNRFLRIQEYKTLPFVPIIPLRDKANAIPIASPDLFEPSPIAPAPIETPLPAALIPYREYLQAKNPIMCRHVMIQRDPTYTLLVDFYEATVGEKEITSKIQSVRSLTKDFLIAKIVDGHLSEVLTARFLSIQEKQNPLPAAAP